MILLYLLTALIAGAPTTAPESVVKRIDTTTARNHLQILASDEMRGRDTPSPELELAADYIKERFRSYGLEPVNGTYDHQYNLVRTDLALPCTMQVTRGGSTFEGTVKTDFIPFEQTGEGTISSAPIVFAGFGIDAAEYEYNDYKNVDVRGAVVLVLRGEPENSDSVRFRGKEFTRYSSLSYKIGVAKRKGAIGILVVDALRTPRRPFVSGFPWPSLYPSISRSARPLSVPDSASTFLALHVGERVVDVLLDSLGTVRMLTHEIDSTLTPRSFRITGASLSASVRLEREIVVVRNIMGMIRGADVSDEYAVVGAHYDHIGVGKPVAGDSIFNGADDNASGTTGLLLAAEAMAKGGIRPPRSIVFVAFSGEEKGLLGSKAYVKSSPLPLAKCVGMINMDMIGRCENNKLSIGGNMRCPDLIRMNEEENKLLESPLTLAYDIESYFFRSDQASFAMKRIPVIFYFTGEHSDYHKLGDHVEKIKLQRLVDITQLATRLTWRVSALPRTTYVPAGFEDP